MRYVRTTGNPGLDREVEGLLSRLDTLEAALSTQAVVSPPPVQSLPVPAPGGGASSNPMTAAGDIIVGGVAGLPTRLAAGADSKVLTLSGGTPVWSPNIGAKGDPGIFVIGADGIDGEDGPRGFPGVQGVTGPAGPVAVGMDGMDGDEGPIGPIGPVGPQGIQGVVGVTGPQGAIGMGLDGADGEDGWPMPGIPGPKGDTGATGAAGAGANPFAANTRRFRASSGDKLVGAVGTPHVGSTFSFSCWVKLLSGGQQAIWSRWTNSTTARELYIHTDTSTRIEVDIPFIVAALVGATSLSTATWYHVAVTRSGSSWILYINGVSDATASSALASETGPQPTIGQDNSAAGLLNGSLHDICFWSVALTPTEVLSLTTGTDPASVQGASLVYRLPITGQASPEVESIAANNATVTGTTPASYF